MCHRSVGEILLMVRCVGNGYPPHRPIVMSSVSSESFLSQQVVPGADLCHGHQRESRLVNPIVSNFAETSTAKNPFESKSIVEAVQ